MAHGEGGTRTELRRRAEPHFQRAFAERQDMLLKCGQEQILCKRNNRN
ncbi:MAG: hypothetical protein ACK55Z_29435 [bacterium]